MVILLVTCTIIFVASLSLVLSGKGDPFDFRVSAAIISKRRSSLTKIMHFFTEIGKGVPTTVIIASLFFMLKSSVTLPKIAAFSTISTLFIGKALKNLIQRVRPTENRLVEEKDFSFPSAHALSSAALYGSIALNSTMLAPSLHLSTILLCILLIFCIGFSRVYLGIHYLLDVIGGWSLGLVIASAFTLLFASGIL